MDGNKYIKYIKAAFFMGAFLVLLFIVVFLLTGCSYQQELDDLGIVAGIAVDTQNGQSTPVEITAQVVSFSSGGSSEGKSSGDGPSGEWNLKLKGESVFESIRSALDQSNRKLYLSHNQVLIFGRETAQNGLKDYTDFFIRDYEARMNVPLVIADGKASELLEVKPKNAVLSAEFLSDLISLQNKQGDCVDTRLFTFAQNLASWERGTLVPIVGTEGEGEEKQLKIKGTAVIKNDTMVGELDAITTRGVSWVLGTVTEGTLTVITSQGLVTVEITDAKASRKITFDDSGKMHVNIKIQQTGIIGHATGGAGSGYEKNTEEIQKAVEKEIEKEIRAGKEKLVEYQCDAYGFGDYLRRFDHDRWKKINSDWYDIMKDMEFHTEVRSDIKNTGALEENI